MKMGVPPRYIDLREDVYLKKQYVSLYLSHGHEIFEFDYHSGSDSFYNLSIKRPIDRIGNIVVNDGYYDLETAYGYGGYYSTTKDNIFLQKAFNAYCQKCLNEGIVAEFIRFHPYNTLSSMSKDALDFLSLDRQTVSIDLTLEKAERWSNYSSTTRNIIRKASPNLHFYESDDVDGFMKLYQSTMEKNNADFFYYFNKEYYEKLCLIENIKLFAVEYDGCIINMSFVLLGRDLAHYHLSANNSNFTKLNGNYYLIDSICDYLQKNNSDISQFHLGGGRSGLDGDSLLAFKSKFSHIRNNFYIAGKIFNRAIFQKYTEAFHELYPELKSEKYFLKYRMDVK